MEPDLTPADDSRSRIVLASGSRYRARVLTDAGYDVEIDPPRVDERILDPLFHSEGPQHLATELARLKVLDVAPRHPGATVLAGDQVGVLTAGDRQVLLSKTPDARSAVRQLMAMSGTVHRLVNAIVVMRVPRRAVGERCGRGNGHHASLQRGRGPPLRGAVRTIRHRRLLPARGR
ncbi:MAG: Maf family protein [Microthrixaceae bacterium]